VIGNKTCNNQPNVSWREARNGTASNCEFREIVIKIFAFRHIANATSIPIKNALVLFEDYRQFVLLTTSSAGATTTTTTHF
jgi:hypothetical protein